MKNKIVLLVGDHMSSRIIYHRLCEKFDIEYVIIEKKIDKKTLLKRRIKKLGLRIVFGQVLFSLFVVPLLKRKSQKRIEEIKIQNQLNDAEIPTEKIKRVSSVNAQETIDILTSTQPSLVVVNGTRIISKSVISFSNTIFINTHAGITPKYRGVHGMYWALVNNDKENAGVTVHFVNSGIDTGGIIRQQSVSFTPEDNFVTYPLLQLAAGVKMLEQSINDFFSHSLTMSKNELESKLWYHPSFLQYIYYRIVRKVK